MSLENLTKSTEVPTALPQAPLLHYKVLPSDQGQGQVAAEYLTTSPAIPSVEGEKRWKAGHATIKFTDREGKELEKAFPTLV